MKPQLLLLLFFCVAVNTQAQTLLQSQSFENGEALNYTHNGFLQDNTGTLYGGTTVQKYNQYFQRATQPGPAGDTRNSLPNRAGTTNPVWPLNPVSGGALDGDYFWAGEATLGVLNYPRPPAYVMLNALNVSGKSNLLVKVALLDPRYTGDQQGSQFTVNDTVQVQVRLDNTGPWVTIGRFLCDQAYLTLEAGGGSSQGNMRLDANLNNVIDAGEKNGPLLTKTMTDFSFEVGLSGSTMQTRVVVSTYSITKEIGFDNIRVLGTTTSGKPPVLASIEPNALPYQEGQPATVITSTLTVSDADSPTLSYATAKITANYKASEDILAFSGDATTGNIAATAFSTATGSLSLTSAGSTATLAQWQSALRKITYQDTNPKDASPLTRTVTFTLTDPTGLGAASSRSITVSTALDAASSLPYTEAFETDGEGTRYASNHFYLQDAIQFQRTTANPADPNGRPTTFSNIAGSGYWFGVNTLSTVNPSAVKTGVVTTKQVNTAGFTNLHFQIRLGASVPNGLRNGTGASWLNTYYFQLFYRQAGSGSWIAFGLFRGTESDFNNYGVLRQDSNPTGAGVPTGTQLTAALQNFDFALPAALNGQTLEFQLVLANSDANNAFAFDQLQVTGTANNPPLIANQSRSIGENSANGTLVGAVIVASDPDAGQTLSYSLVGGNTNNTFAINATTGQLTVANSAALNYEVTPSYGLVVQVSDTGTPPRSTTATVTVTVTNVNELVAVVTSLTNVSCQGGTTGAATVTASGENPPFSYAWRNATTNTPLTQTTPTVTGLSAGVYSVTVTATSSGFTATTSLTISQPTALSLTTAHTNVSSLGASTGSASVSVSGGTPAYSYDWSPGSPTGDGTSSISSLSAGTYSVQVTDANGCQITRSVTVSTDSDLTPSLYARPSTLYGNAPFSVVVDVQELNGVSSSGPVTLKISRDAQTSLVFDPGLSSVGGRSVQNGSWSFSSDDSYYIFTTTQVIVGGGTLSLGLSGQLTAKATSGQFTLSVSLGGGAESKLINNSDAEKVEYFPQ